MTQLPKTHLEKIEAGIVDALKNGGLSSRYLIEIFPDKPEEFDFEGADKILLVQYTGSRFDAPEQAGSGMQMRAPVFALHLHLRRTQAAVRGLREIDQVRLAVQGLALEGAKLRLVRDGLANQSGEFWHYVIELTCRIPAVPHDPAHPIPFVTDFSKGGA